MEFWGLSLREKFHHIERTREMTQARESRYWQDHFRRMKEVDDGFRLAGRVLIVSAVLTVIALIMKLAKPQILAVIS